MNAIIPLDGCSPIAWEDVFDEGDRWAVIRGCESCLPGKKVLCCGNCKMLACDTGECRLHNKNQDKPLYCVLVPSPDTCWKRCALEYECVAGTSKGKIRRVRDPGAPNPVFREKPLGVALSETTNVNDR